MYMEEQFITGILFFNLVLESLKKKELLEGYWRRVRKHEAISNKGGISDEHLCVCVAVERSREGIFTGMGR